MTRNQDIRAEVLLQVYAARPVPLSAAVMARSCKKAGMDYTEADIAREAAFLVSNGQLTAGTLATGEERYILTAAGVLAHEKGI